MHFISMEKKESYSPPSESLTSERTLNHTFIIEPRFERIAGSFVCKRAVKPIAFNLRLLGWPMLSN
jgi:hypothetical protein